MIGYVTLGTNDLERAVTFYDALFSEIDTPRLMEEKDEYVAWGKSFQEPALSVTKPFDGNPATVGNGVMVAFVMDSPEKVDSFYAKAMALGAQDEGMPGPRADGAYYAGYFRDMDGNKLNAFCMIAK